MPTVTVSTYATLRQFMDGDPTVTRPIAADTTVRMLLDELGIPIDQTKIILINGRPGTLDQILTGDEKIDLFSAIGGG